MRDVGYTMSRYETLENLAEMFSQAVRTMFFEGKAELAHPIMMQKTRLRLFIIAPSVTTCAQSVRL